MSVVFGVGPVLEALRAGRRPLRALWLAEGRERDGRVAELLRIAGERGIRTGFLRREELTRRARSESHQGVLAEADPLPRVTLEAVFATERSAPALVVALDGVQDPQNLGAILRTAECAGAWALIVPRDRAAELSPAAIKAAEGAAERVPVVTVTNLARTLVELKERGLWTVGVDAGATRPWDRLDWSGPSALVLGGEGEGLRPLVRRTCDDCVSLPLLGHLPALNVSAAAAAVLYELVRQRVGDGGTVSGQRLARGRSR